MKDFSKMDDLKYIAMLVGVGLNVVLYFNCSANDVVFLSTTAICLTCIYYGHGRDVFLTRSFIREKILLDEAEKTMIALNKMSTNERRKFREIMQSL